MADEGPLAQGSLPVPSGSAGRDIAEPLERLGDVTQEVIQPAMSGAEVTRLNMTKANALNELGSGYEQLGQGIAQGVDAAFKGIGASSAANMARQGAVDGASSVTRDANGDIQVQPTTGSLFGLGGGQYANAVSEGTRQQITTNLKSDIDGIARANIGNPAGFQAGLNGYLAGHTGGLGSGVEGKTALLDARDYGQQVYDNSLNQKASKDISQAKATILNGINADQADMVALAQGGLAGGDEFNKTLGHQSDLANSLTGNPAFGVNRDDLAVAQKSRALEVTGATIQGSMATAFQNGGINAAAAVAGTIDNYPGASDADKAQLKVVAATQLSSLEKQNSTAISANKTAFETILKSGVTPPLPTLQQFQARAVYLGDADTAQAAATEIVSHRYSATVTALAPTQQDTLNGVGQPGPLRANYFSSGRAQAAGLNFDPDHPDLTTITTSNGLTANVNKFAAPALQGFVNDLEAEGYNVNDLSGYNNRLKRGGTTLSEHAYGNAIDINPSKNTFGGSTTNMPPGVSQLATKWGLSWGGDWQCKKDFMHFEWAGGATPAASTGGLARGAPAGYSPAEAATVSQIRTGATAGGADPNVMEGIYRGEGRAGYVGDNGSSFGPFQLHMGGLAPGANAVPGAGDDFKRDTGFDPRDPSTVPQQIAWVAKKLKDDPGFISQFHGYQGPAGTQPASSASQGTPQGPQGPTPVSWEDLKNNPGMAPAYATVIAKDAKTRAEAGATILDASTRALQNGILPPDNVRTQIEQLATPEAMSANPQLGEKYGAYSQEMAAYSLANQSMSGGGQSIIDRDRAAAVSQPDILQRQIVDKAQKLRDDSETLLKNNPVAAAINWKAIEQPPVPLDPTQPQTIGQHFAGNAAVVDAVTAREPGADKSVVFKNETGQFGAAMAGPAQTVSAILTAIGQLPQDKRDATLETPEVKTAILGAANSPDPLKKQVAFSFMNQIYRQDPQSFAGKFGDDGLRQLNAWQDVEQYKTQDQIAKDANTANDPATKRAQEALAKEAEDKLKGVTANAVANKLAPHWGQTFGLGGDYKPVSDVPAQTNAIMRDDYGRAFTDQYAKTGDATAADKYAIEKTGLKWGPSDANGGRVMAFPPERSPAYPMVNGNQSYIGTQLADFAAQAGHVGAEAHLVANAITESELKNGKAPGYSVVTQGNDGQYHVLPGRFYADPKAAQAQANDAFQSQQQPLDQQMMANAPPPGVL